MSVIEFSSDIIVKPISAYGGDWLVCDAARVSNKGAEGGGPRDLTTADKGLIKALVTQRHGAPFQHGGLTFFVEAPIFVFREWRTHRIYTHQITDDMSYSEQSARYRGGNPKFWLPGRTRPLMKHSDFKPMRPEFWEASRPDYDYLVSLMVDAYEVAWDKYSQGVDYGAAPEVMRSILGTGMYSSMYVSTNPRSLSNFLSLRTHDEEATFVSYPQLEIEEAARQCETLFAEYWPETYSAWNKAGRHGL